MALAERCEVVYLNHGVSRVGGMAGMLRWWVSRISGLGANWHRESVSKVSDSLSVWSWEGVRSDPWLLTRSDRPSTHYFRLREHIRRKAQTGSKVWLITSRPQALGLINLWAWDRIIVDIEDPWFDLSWGSQVNRDAILKVLKNADAVCANGEMIAREYAERSGRHVLSLPNGVDQAFLDRLDVPGPLPTYFGASPESLRAVFTGNINDRIDYGMLSEIVRADGYHFYFIGQESVPEKSRSEWELIKSRPNVTWVPPVPHGEIAAVLQHAHVLLLPYFQTGHNKMFPAKLFEYAAAAKPIITTIDFAAGSFAIPTLTVCGTSGLFLQEMERLRSTRAAVSATIVAECRALVRRNTWRERASQVLQHASGGDFSESLTGN